MKAVWPAGLLLVVALAGCTGSEAPGQDSSTDPDGDEFRAPVQLTLDGVDAVEAVLREDGQVQYTVTVSGSTDLPAYVYWFIPGIHDGPRPVLLLANGSFTGDWDVWVGPGRETLSFAAIHEDELENGTDTWAEAEITADFPAHATVTIDFGESSDQDAIEDTVWVDIVEYDSRSMYEGQGATHPGYANIHDALVAWETQTGHDVEYSYNSGFGSFSVERIDGEGSPLSAGEPPWWCYQTNDDGYADQGISVKRFVPGDVIAWDLGSCNGVMGGT